VGEGDDHLVHHPIDSRRPRHQLQAHVLGLVADEVVSVETSHRRHICGHLQLPFLSDSYRDCGFGIQLSTTASPRRMVPPLITEAYTPTFTSLC
jgi:hypothetical protein